MNKGLISIIVPVYNVELYLKDCIESILYQSYTNFEVILVNDGSSDNSLNICNHFYTLDKRVILINKINGGLSDARNRGLESAKGDFICFIDSDDIIHQDFLKILITNIDDCDFVMVNYESFMKIEDTSINLYPQPLKYKVFSSYESLQLIETFKYPLFVLAWNKLYKRDLWKYLRFPYGKIHEDEFVIHHILDNCQKVKFIDLNLYYYRQRSDSIMSSAKAEKAINDKIEAYADRRDFFIRNGIKDRAHDLNSLIITKCALREVSKDNKHFIKIVLSDYIFNSKISIKYRILLFLKFYFYFFYKLLYSFKGDNL